ncbi:MAG: LamG domain-containing protein [Anaerolineae bacterium]|nr:LamG domain-containing protein [Anaerolineae bacterium]
MAVQADYLVDIDLNGDRDFSDANEDVSAYWKRMEWSLGVDQPYDAMARAATLEMTLINEDGRFSPEHASGLSGFAPGALVRVRSLQPTDVDGTYSGVTLGQTGIGDGNTCARFPGGSNIGYANIPAPALDIPFDPDAGTISVWCTADAGSIADGSWRQVIRLTGSGSNNYICIYADAVVDRIQLAYYAGGTWKSVALNTPDTGDSAWYHFVLTWDTAADEMKGYANAVQLDSTRTGLGTWVGPLATNKCCIGTAQAGTIWSTWSGKIAHCAIWDKALTADQVGQLYRANTRQEDVVLDTERDDLIGYWMLDEANGSTAASSTGKTNHFIGWIDKDGIRPAPGTRGKRETVVKASGWMSRLQDDEVFLEVQEGKRTDEVIQALMSASAIYPPGSMGWFLDIPGFMSLGQTTTLAAGFEDFTDMGEGATVLNYAGDNWEEGVSVYRAVSDVVEAEGEGALLYIDRAGQLVFRGRHWPHQDMPESVDATLTQDDIREDGFRYAYGDRIVNDVTISLRPREVGDTIETLGTLTNPVKIEPGESRTVRIRYDDGSDNRIGGKEVSMGSWSAKSESDGGSDLTGYIAVELEEGATGAEITFANSGSKVAYIQAGAAVQGYKITDFGGQEATLADEDSIVAYGRQKMQMRISLLDDLDVAEALAQGLIFLRKEPQGQIEAVTLVANRSDTLMTQALGLTIGDRIEISEGQTGSDGEYFIVGEQHQVSSQYEHLVTWTLRPAPARVFWLLGKTGFSEVDTEALSTTLLGF